MNIKEQIRGSGFFSTKICIACVSSIVDEILIVKDVLGQVYFPFYNYNGLGNLKPGKGYLIKMHSNQVLDYSLNNR